MSVIDMSGGRRRCEDGILADYVTFAGHQESPLDFHLWTGIGLMSIAMGRKCYLNFSYGATYPNLYIILVGESAITHKSTALSMGIGGTLRPALDTALDELSDPGSPQALMGELSEICEEKGNAEGFIHASELSVVLGQQKLDDSLLKLLTHLWDCPAYHAYATRGRGKEELKNVYLTFLGGSTPVWLRNSVPAEALEGGFFSRLILVNRPATGLRNALPLLTYDEREAHERVKNDLAYIAQNVHGEFQMNQAARNLYIEWYEERNHPHKAKSFMRGYYGRKGSFVLKLAMIRSVDYNDSMIINDDDILWALDILQKNERYTEGIVKYMGTTQDGANTRKVLTQIRKGIVTIGDREVRGILHSNLLRSLSYMMRGEEIKSIIETLEEQGDIKIHIGKKKLYEFVGEDEDNGLGE